MITVKFGINLKMISSTSRSLFVDPIEVEVSLKSPTSITKPVLVVNQRLDDLDDNEWYKFNYCYIEEFNRYYYIDDIYVNNYANLEIACHVDVLATYKDMICSTPYYVKYCGDARQANFLLDDERLTPDIDVMAESAWASLDPNHNIFSESGCVVMSYFGSTQPASGGQSNNYKTGINIVAITLDNFKSMWGGLNGFYGKWSVADDLSTFVNNLIADNNCKDLILSARWFPLSYDSMPGSSVSSFYLGTVKVDIPAKILNSDFPYKVFYNSTALSLQFGVDDLPDSTYKGTTISFKDVNFLKSTKYTSIHVSHPSGITEINDGSFDDVQKVYFTMAIEFLSGNYCMSIYSCNMNDGGGIYKSNLVAQITGNMGLDFFAHTQADVPTIAGMQYGTALKAAGTVGAIGGGMWAAGAAGLGAGATSQIAGAGVTTASAASYIPHVTSMGSTALSVPAAGALSTGVRGIAGAASAAASAANAAGAAQVGTSFIPNLTGIKAAAKGLAVTKGIMGLMPSDNSKPPVAGSNSLSHCGGLAGLLSVATTPITGSIIIYNIFLFNTVSRIPAIIKDGNYAYWGTMHGFPCGKVMQLSSITTSSANEPKYVECVNAQLCPANLTSSKTEPYPTPEEIEAVNTALNTGFYIQA